MARYPRQDSVNFPPYFLLKKPVKVVQPMMQADDVRKLLLAGLNNCEVEVNGDGSHFTLVVIGEVFTGLSAVKKQQLVYSVLAAQFADGSIHAIDSLKTFTPAQWQAQQR